jgi:hypothetical protein
MGSSENSQKKMDVLDMIIGVLREHEVNLDRLCKRLDNLVDVIGTKDIAEEKEPLPLLKPIEEKRGSLIIESIDNWKDFKTNSRGADFVVFEISKMEVGIYAGSGRTINKYMEPIFNGKNQNPYYIENLEERPKTEEGMANVNLRCGLDIPFTHSSSISSEEELSTKVGIKLDVTKVKNWLAEQLNVDRKKIVAGRLKI